MDPRHRTIAIQAVGVAILAAIVYLAFLRPSDPSELSGIDAGEGLPSAVTPSGPTGPQGPDPDDRDEGRDGKKGDGPGAGGPRSSPDGDSPGEFVPGDTPGSSGASPPFEGSGTPSDDQYGDTVARLLDQIGEGGSLSRSAAPGE